MPNELTHIVVTKEDDVIIIKQLHNALFHEDDIRRFGEEMFTAVEKEESPNAILSFEGVSQITSSSLGKLITLQRRIDKVGGQLRLSDMGVAVKDVFRISKLDTYFKICADHGEALKSF